VTEYEREIEQWIALKLVTGKCSRILISELAIHMQRRTLHVHMILDEIGALEGAPGAKPSNTKQPKRLKYKPLKGLWHKHFMQPAYIYENIKNHWAKRLEELADCPAENLAHKIVLSGYTDRSTKHALTGEWIVFAKHDGINYYLTLGRHGDDQQAWDRCRDCAQEFSELALLRA
jgi:hypothetical protein